MRVGKKQTNSSSTTFNLPRRLRRLADLAYNLWWTWGRDADQVFELIDRGAWEVAYHNPVGFLRLVEHDRLIAATQDNNYLDLYDRVIQGFDDYLTGGDHTWYAQRHPEWLNQPIAYFCAEFGLHEALPIYAGGMGVLSGDYLKEASDLGLPLIAVGILYKQGYFIQAISKDGGQEAHYADLSFSDLPIIPILDDQGDCITRFRGWTGTSAGTLDGAIRCHPGCSRSIGGTACRGVPHRDWADMLAGQRSGR